MCEQEKERIQSRNASLAKQSYAHRFVDPLAAQRFDVGDYQWLHTNLNHEKDTIAMRNAEHRRRIQATKAKTEDDVNSNEAARAAREQAAKASAQRRKDEAARIRKENLEFRKSLQDVKAVVDDDLTNDLIGGMSVAEQRAAKAQATEKAREKTRKENAERAAELQRLKKNAQARTDANLMDDVLEDGTLVAENREKSRRQVHLCLRFAPVRCPPPTISV